MIRPAEALSELRLAKLPDGVQADIGDVGKFPGDFRHVGETGEVARGDAEHFALFELPQLLERRRRASAASDNSGASGIRELRGAGLASRRGCCKQFGREIGQ